MNNENNTNNQTNVGGFNQNMDPFKINPNPQPMPNNTGMAPEPQPMVNPNVSTGMNPNPTPIPNNMGMAPEPQPMMNPSVNTGMNPSPMPMPNNMGMTSEPQPMMNPGFNGEINSNPNPNFNTPMNNQPNTNENINGNYANNNFNNPQFQKQPTLQNSKQGGNGIITLIIIIAVIAGGIFLVTKFLGGSKGGTIQYGKEAVSKSKMYNLSISIGDVQKGVEYKPSDSLLFAAFSLNGTYTKVKVNIKNNDSKEASINPLLFVMNLMDDSKEKIASCDFGGFMRDERYENEKLPDTVAANSSISGYIYCKTTSTAASILYMNIPTNVKEDSSGKISIEGADYYFKLQ